MQNTNTVQIETDLYDRLRAYCDQKNIRFNEFAENVFESAIDQEKMLKMVDDAREVLQRVGRECKSAYQQGFRSGLMAGALAAQGRMGLSEFCTPPETREKGEIFRVVEGSQKSFFLNETDI